MDPERERATAAFMRELDWSGVFNLQLIERDGRDYVIDLNPRFYVSLTLAVKAGINLPAIWVALLLGDEAPEIGDFRPGMRFRQEKGDPRAIAAELRRGNFAARARPPAAPQHRARAVLDPRSAAGPEHRRRRGAQDESPPALGARGHRRGRRGPTRLAIDALHALQCLALDVEARQAASAA